RLKDPSRFRYIGKGELKLIDAPNIASGKAQYGIDTRLPGMLYAVVARPPVYGGKVAKYDAAQALKVPGVVRVVEIEQSPPPAETARIVNGKCEAWGCIQSPQAARDRIAKRLGMSVENVKVNVTLLGGGFGRKSKPDFMIEAAVLSKAMAGAPVKVTWTREDDLHNSSYHTVSVEHLEAR